MQQQKNEEKKDIAGKEQPDIMEIPSNQETVGESAIREQTPGKEIEAESAAVNADANSMEGETRDVVAEQEPEEGEEEFE